MNNVGPWSLQTLPVELLYEIFLFSGSSSLPLTSKHMYAVCKSAPSSIQAEYIMTRYADSMEHTTRSKPGLITKALRYPMCTQSVLEAMLRIPACAQLECSASGATELPRRLFRSLSSQEKKLWNTEDAPLPLLRYLYAHPRIPTPHADSWDGYPLTRAVASGFIPLVHFLLDKEASPAHKGAIAVHVAIRRRDLRLVKMLIEPDVSPAPVREGELKHDTHKGGKVSIRKRRKPVEEDYGAKKGAKRRRIEDRVSVNAAMLKAAVACDARDIAEYFMKEKSCIPDMETVKLLSAQQSGSERKKTNRHNPGSHHCKCSKSYFPLQLII